MAGQLLTGAIGALGVLFFQEIASGAKSELMKLAAEEVLERMGIQLDLNGPISKESITQAICDGPLQGRLQFTNLFDRDAVKADIKRIAIERAGQAFGFEGGLSIEEVKTQLVSVVLDDVRQQVEAGGGVYLNVAKELGSALQIVAKKKYVPPELDMSEKAIRNRQYQAKWRANNKKYWVER